MNSKVKVSTGDPGEAWIALIGKGGEDIQNLSVAFPQYTFLQPLHPLRQFVEGDDLVLVIDADALGDILESGSPCQLKVPELDLIENIIWPDIQGKRSVDRSVMNTKSAQPLPKPSPIIPEKINIPLEERLEILPKVKPISSQEEVDPDYSTEEEVTAVTEEKKNKSILILAAFLGALAGLLLIVGGLIWYKYVPHYYAHPPKTVKSSVKKEQTSTVVDQSKAQTHPPIQINASFSGDSLANLSVTDVINEAPSTASITQEALKRLTNNKADDGVLLLENAASRGDASAMIQLAQLYDPVNFKTGGPIPSPDLRESARYFQKAVQTGSKEAEAPRAVLHDWLEQQAKAGDEMAKLALKDFWP